MLLVSGRHNLRSIMLSAQFTFGLDTAISLRLPRACFLPGCCHSSPVHKPRLSFLSRGPILSLLHDLALLMADTDSQTTRFPEEDIIVFTPNDPEDPRNWLKLKKHRVIALICILAFVAVFGSSSYVRPRSMSSTTPLN